MPLASATIVGIALVQITLGAVLGLGLGVVPRLGMIGVALGQVIAYSVAAFLLGAFLLSRAARVRLSRNSLRLSRAAFWQILRVGLIGCLSPLQTVLTVLVVTALVSRLGDSALAGYGIGARLEFLLIPIAFGVGVASLPMVGIAIGRRDVPRARRVAWTGALLAGSFVGLIGALVCIWPTVWPRMFTPELDVLQFSAEYLRFAGPGYAFFGFGLALFFASQGAGRIAGPVLAGTLRLAVVTLGGLLLWRLDASSASYFALVSIAMVAYGIASAVAVARSNWQPY